MEPLDWGALRENCAGDESLVNEVLDLFRGEAGALLSDVGKAIDAGDAVAVKRAAHRLKGALVSLGARPSTERARALEACGGAGELATAPDLYAQLETEMARLLSVISLPQAA
ncbi:MAG: Hpt domain-containing protein [Archangium sp.]|nr:Hpt domain-containing protein [Archangium sp.]